jgi:hypothetical protein
MTGKTPPFAAFEWMIAWRYLRARRAEGGVSAMTVISFLGIMLAVFALIATLVCALWLSGRVCGYDFGRECPCHHLFQCACR